ncbi:unnamed protein product [Peronospora effusa]|uniref:Poly(A) RNA polymerase mitochondrial-like central palm domain-containing protein n=1 Tax=Peronospora effusa TaxID=542832 RepID=A0A3M6V7E1_9STRA|nr:hypothetical protein DD238_003607 [Peronospora effusa]RQM16235.1 hypothetical protein DD237_003015 [Peronospora effusa]CAI5711693.1 unnamed protein product [Peronospora effusa]
MPTKNDKVCIRSHETAMDKELNMFAERVMLSTKERKLRIKVYEDVRDLISSAFQDATVQLYGSSSTGLDTFRSDLDISVGNLTLSSSQYLPKVVVVDEEEEKKEEEVVKELQQKKETDAHMNVPRPVQDKEEEASFSLNLALPVGTVASVDNAHITRRVQFTPASHWNPTLRRRKLRVLRALQHLLKSQRPHFQLKCLHKARIPILMVLDTKTKLAIDIGVNRETFEISEHGRSTSLAKRLQDTLGAPFTTIVMFLKEFLHQYELDKLFTGGLGSFRLYMMVAFIFQRYGSNKPRPPVSSLLLAFFELFGNKKLPKFLHEGTQLPLPFGEGGHMDFGGVFRIDDCVETFAMAFDILSSTGNIGSIIYEERVEEDRKMCQINIEQRV